MKSRKNGSLPIPLERLQRRFQQWRETRKTRTRIPDSLWNAAVKMAGRYGLCRTAQALPVDYYSLKERMEQHSVADGRPALGGADTLLTWPAGPAGESRKLGATNTFVELPPSLPASGCDCTLELEDADGSRMRLHLKTAAPPDLAALCRSFRNPTS